MKTPGHCVVCGELGFEVLEIWPASSPFAGQPRRLGEPLEDIARATLVCRDGTLMDLTVHQHCVAELPDVLPQVWRDVLERYTFERKHHRELKQRDFIPQQNAAADQEQLRFINNPPLGVLSVQEWRHEYTG